MVISCAVAYAYKEIAGFKIEEFYRFSDATVIVKHTRPKYYTYERPPPHTHTHKHTSFNNLHE